MNSIPVPEVEKQCIAPIDSGLYRCPNLAIYGVFCPEHHSTCGPLYSLYKKTCSKAKRDNLIANDEIPTHLRKAIKANKACIRNREKFKRECVVKECEDSGHTYYYGQFLKAEKREEKELGKNY